ncbi:MAG: DUF1254 domain-containing protein [Planctomycetota bacterium]
MTHAQEPLTPVTPETYIRAETDFAFADFQKNAGGKINQFFFIRTPTPLDAQTVVRMNRDTLYAGAVVDTKGGATVTIPEFPDDRYFSVLVIDNDHYAPTVYYEPGTHALPTGTKYVSVIQRIQLMNPADPDDVKLVNLLQDRITIDASSADPFPKPAWDKVSMLKLRAEYEKEFQQFAQYEADWMGPRGQVNEKTRHLACAGAWGLFPEKDAVYINYTGPSDPSTCYTATYEVPENDAFWSITVYGSDGFMKSDANVVNDRNVTLNADGTFTVWFGSQEACGDKPNRVDISEGWNFLMRVYRPGPGILKREYELPKVKEVVGASAASGASEPAYAKARNEAGDILVDESNFTIAETDRYFADHVKEHPVNTFRHSRAMSSKDNQFVVRENRDVMYSHAVVDISEGATLVNPAWDVFSVIQVIDENQYTIASIYPGEQKTFTPKDVALGDHVFLNMRTGVRSLDEKGYAEAHAHQDSVRIEANSSKPYEPKGFDKKSLDETRSRLKGRMEEADKPQYYFGTKEAIEPTQFLIASAVGIFGLPIKDAAYLNTIQPTGKAKEGAPCRLTLPVPPLDFDKGGFFSVTTYDSKGWIVKDEFALSNATAKSNADGSYTFHFNAPGKRNNIDVVEGWTVLIRLYAPKSVEAIMEYMRRANETVRFELLGG